VKYVVCTHEHITHVLAAVLVYLYIFLSLSTGPPLKGTAPTFPLQWPALAFGTLGLLLICGINETRFRLSLLAILRVVPKNVSPNHLLCSGELPLTLAGQRRVAYDKIKEQLILAPMYQVS
jgi:hypothetical protein